MPVLPHDASGPINVMAGAQVMMSVPSFYRLDARRADLGFYDVQHDAPLVVRDGALRVPRRPGLGVRLNAEYLEGHQIQ